ncbi:TPA: hypothetical protein N0F65_009133 [Lagenidium giganteum]|uniref:BHLH domain-containing protein n=1 Tax=Lagenidium giganteum TaxID=4803 RepID=A0AAV2YJC1_9STRA|nr:TPA: hypothetical protein N0F65_009133 [Lagenidium giganteum]
MMATTTQHQRLPHEQQHAPSSSSAASATSTTTQQQTTPPHMSGKPGDDPSLEITYSTISPKVESASPYPVHIKLNLIDQIPNTDNASCESPFPMTPMTPGSSSGDLSKKQRHNLREQRRILRISNQFDILRNKLEAAGYSSNKKDKYSVLQATLDYITQLERNQRVGSTAMHNGGAGPSGGSTGGMHNSNGLGLSIQAPSNSQMDNKGAHSFMIDSMPSPVPALSMPVHQFPMDMDSNMFGANNNNSGQSFPNVECIEGSTASYKDVYVNSSMPSLLAKLDGTIVEANSLFLELCCKNIDELRLHSLYTMCTAMDAPKMYSLVNKVLACEMASAQSKMLWHFANSGDRKVFVSVSMIHDSLHRPANLHCSLLPLS